MVWEMQDMQKTLNDNEIEAPMLLDGIAIKEDKDSDEWAQKRQEKLKQE